MGARTLGEFGRGEKKESRDANDWGVGHLEKKKKKKKKYCDLSIVSVIHKGKKQGNEVLVKNTEKQGRLTVKIMMKRGGKGEQQREKKMRNQNRGNWFLC